MLQLLTEEENSFTVMTFSKDPFLLWVFLDYPLLKPSHYIGYWKNASNYLISQLRVRIFHSGTKKKWVYQEFNVDAVPVAYKLIKNETPAQVILGNFENICSACNFIKNETSSQIFSCEFLETFQPAILLKNGTLIKFCNIFKRTYFLDYLRTAASNNTRFLLDSFIISIVHLKAVSTTFVLVCFLSLNESTRHSRKNFYFTSKALFFLEKIQF